jgi:hypothetical protein
MAVRAWLVERAWSSGCPADKGPKLGMEVGDGVVEVVWMRKWGEQ